jgi:hypothetical protein
MNSKQILNSGLQNNSAYKRSPSSKEVFPPDYLTNLTPPPQFSLLQRLFN